MVRCACGHLFCEEHRIENPEAVDISYGIDLLCCPICQFQTIRDDDLRRYLLKKSGLTKAQIAEEIRKNFTHFQEFREFIK
jgi:hypothetical protein